MFRRAAANQIANQSDHLRQWCVCRLRLNLDSLVLTYRGCTAAEVKPLRVVPRTRASAVRRRQKRRRRGFLS